MPFAALVESSSELTGIMDSGLAESFAARWGAGSPDRLHTLARAFIEQILGSISRAHCTASSKRASTSAI
jgi:hypothetical protein